MTRASAANAPYISCEPQQDGNDVILNIVIKGKLIPMDKNRGEDILTVHTENKKYPTMQFKIWWDVPLLIVVDHEQMTWMGSAGKEYKDKIILKHIEGKSFRILKAKPTIPQIKVTGVSKNSAAQHTIEVSLSPKAKAGGYQEVIAFTLDDPMQQTLEVSIVAVLR